MIQDYMKLAFKEAFLGIRTNKGGPFGAIIVDNKGKIIAKGCNLVSSTNDPTAHAEVVAIRRACQKLNHFHLPHTSLYTTCEPCPMCLSAIYWANIESVYYGAGKNDADKIGFNDKFIYEELNKTIAQRKIKMEQVETQLSEALFEEWVNKENKIDY